MASAFGHAAAALAVASLFRPPAAASTARPRRFLLLAVGCALAPDLDLLGMRLGIPYEHLLGHRGLSHSLLVAALLASVALAALPRRAWPVARWRAWCAFALAAASHGLLDACTDGGGGVALLAPFSAERFFLPWRPICVSPLGLSRFLGARGLAVLRSEALWIGLPAALLALAGAFARRLRARRPSPVAGAR